MSFNIGRTRRADEGREAAWGAEGGYSFDDHENSGPGKTFCYGDGDTWEGRKLECTPADGCMVVFRGKAISLLASQVPSDHNGEDGSKDDDYADDDYADEGHEEDRCEYETPAESEADEHASWDVASQDSDEDEHDDEEAALYASFRTSLATHPTTPQPDEMHPVWDENGPRALERTEWEHIAGPGCKALSAYSGHRITADEMYGCTTAQCLVPKPADSGRGWSPYELDQPFEASGQYFLSGLSDDMPSTDYGGPRFLPIRHGCDEAHAWNSYYEPARYELAMPFHPACMEVYRRASLRKTGRFDVEGLMAWYTKPRHRRCHRSINYRNEPAVERGARGQWWKHVSGDEFLAANPCFVPALPGVLEGVVRSTDEDFDFRSSAFTPVGGDTQPIVARQPDILAKLPEELKLEMLSHLSSKDIANLRLASRTFRYLSQYFFRQLLLRECPWLWEIWCLLPYSPWTCLTAQEIHGVEVAHEEEKAKLDFLDENGDYPGVDPDETQVLHDYIYKPLREHRTAERRALYNNLARAESCLELVKLPQGKVDYHGLYLAVARNWDRLKGLRNRRRIWRDCEVILEEVDGLGTDG